MIKILSDSFKVKYRLLWKPILFLLDAEVVHNFFIKLGAWLGFSSLAKKMITIIFGYQNSNLNVLKNGILFPNPVGLAAGFDYNGQLTGILPALGFGFHTIGTITFEPYQGNPKPRLGRLPKSKSLLVNKGLKNIGAKACINFLKNREKILPLTIPTGISIGSSNKAYLDLKEQILDTLKCFLLFEKSGLAHSYYELNISCPNTFGGEPFSIPSHLEILLTCLDKMLISKPIYVKFPIDQAWQKSKVLLDIIDSHCPAGVIIGNLTKDKINPLVHPSEKPRWANQKGNLSGKPTWERSNTLIEKTRRLYGNRFTIIGTGGIFTGEDAQHKIKLGADLVQLITGMIYEGPGAIGQINHFLNQSKSIK
jgi:dihydroorotate dehydrogenase